MDHQRRTAMTDQLLNGLALFLFIVVAITNQQEITGVIRDLFYGFDHCTENGSDTSPTTSPMVSVDCWARARALALG